MCFLSLTHSVTLSTMVNVRTCMLSVVCVYLVYYYVLCNFLCRSYVLESTVVTLTWGNPSIIESTRGPRSVLRSSSTVVVVFVRY